MSSATVNMVLCLFAVSMFCIIIVITIGTVIGTVVAFVVGATIAVVGFVVIVRSVLSFGKIIVSQIGIVVTPAGEAVRVEDCVSKLATEHSLRNKASVADLRRWRFPAR